jgi:hypothetical protein
MTESPFVGESTTEVATVAETQPVAAAPAEAPPTEAEAAPSEAEPAAPENPLEQALDRLKALADELGRLTGSLSSEHAAALQQAVDDVIEHTKALLEKK